MRDALKDVPDPRDNHGIPDHIYRGGVRTYAGHTGSDLDLPAKTVKAGGHGVPGGENMMRFRDGLVRYFTVYEAKLIQTFPKDFVILGAWGEALRQIGNAVPVVLGEQIGKALYSKISSGLAGRGLSEPQRKAPTVRTIDSASTCSVCEASNEHMLQEEPTTKAAKRKSISVSYREAPHPNKPNGQRKPKKAIGNHVPRAKHAKPDN